MYSAERDGIDHINIYSKSKVELGRALSNFAWSPFKLAGLGEFASVEGFWYWLKCKDDRLRKVWGFEAKRLGREIIGSDGAKENPEFKALIKRALVEKVRAHPEIEAMLKESSLPFAHYYVFNGREVAAGFEWIVEAWEEIRRKLKS